MTSEYQRYLSAANTFRDKYFALPGDMSNATKFWGAADAGDGTGTDCFDVSSTSATTCDGNGNGQITDAGGGRFSESYRAWQHLANAGLIEGSYTGRAATATYGWSLVGGSNVPASKVSQGQWLPNWIGTLSGDVNTFDGDYGNTLYLGSGGSPLGLTMKAEEMWNIDTKLDDGKPAYGKVRANKFVIRSNCSSTNVSATAEYVLTSTAIGCNLMFLQAM